MALPHDPWALAAPKAAQHAAGLTPIRRMGHLFCLEDAACAVLSGLTLEGARAHVAVVLAGLPPCIALQEIVQMPGVEETHFGSYSVCAHVFSRVILGSPESAPLLYECHSDLEEQWPLEPGLWAQRLVGDAREEGLEEWEEGVEGWETRPGEKLRGGGSKEEAWLCLRGAPFRTKAAHMRRLLQERSLLHLLVDSQGLSSIYMPTARGRAFWIAMRDERAVSIACKSLHWVQMGARYLEAYRGSSTDS